MSVKLSMDDAMKLNPIFEAIAIVNEEVDFKLDEKGLSVREMDDERVAMVDLYMPHEMFSEYDVPIEQRFMVNLANFKKVKLKQAPATFTFNSKTLKCLIQQDRPFGRIFSIPFLTSENVEVPQVKGEFDATAKMTLEELRKIVDDGAEVSDHFTIEASKEKLRFGAAGDFLTYEAQIPVGNEVLLEPYLCKNTAKACFSLNYLEEITKKTALAELVQLNLKTDFPMLLALEPKELKSLQLSYALAPRLET